MASFRTLSTAFALSLSLVACSTYTSNTPNMTSPMKHTLEEGEWHVEDLARKGIVDSSVISMTFDKNGRVSGSASCNRFNGQYTAQGSSLNISKTASTRMMCSPALMNQESLFLALLEKTQSYSFTADGALLLKTTDGEVITARH
ncbi:META domain-containing protein [Hydromonas duriensis]|uniref:Heat shock protein HslJ n=1 Tax=Hydromonas duriensis TaxID=1527608 RepID=A0A4R6Y7Z9_9BURK|nr:META domain-containing protein [Hydromonas duriensis]TDR31496.1 heat shock protein HslJ [Hydromonas duriensis]